MVQFKDFEADRSWGDGPPRRIATAVEKLNAWITSDPAIRVLSIETITWDADGWSDKSVERGVRVWFVPS